MIDGVTVFEGVTVLLGVTDGVIVGVGVGQLYIVVQAKHVAYDDITS